MPGVAYKNQIPQPVDSVLSGSLMMMFYIKIRILCVLAALGDLGAALGAAVETVERPSLEIIDTSGGVLNLICTVPCQYESLLGFNNSYNEGCPRVHAEKFNTSACPSATCPFNLTSLDLTSIKFQCSGFDENGHKQWSLTETYPSMTTNNNDEPVPSGSTIITSGSTIVTSGSTIVTSGSTIVTSAAQNSSVFETTNVDDHNNASISSNRTSKILTFLIFLHVVFMYV